MKKEQFYSLYGKPNDKKCYRCLQSGYTQEFDTDLGKLILHTYKKPNGKWCCIEHRSGCCVDYDYEKTRELSFKKTFTRIYCACKKMGKTFDEFLNSLKCSNVENLDDYCE